jgi:hypothetical protein
MQRQMRDKGLPDAKTQAPTLTKINFKRLAPTVVDASGTAQTVPEPPATSFPSNSLVQ